jgi:Holliday junction resolvase-like predicted endonuclease
MSLTQWVGSFGEGYVKDILEGRGYQTLALQTTSGHGIDIIGVKNKYGRSMLLVVEVKASSGTKAPSLRATQGNLAEWARARLVSVANGRGAYRALSSRDRDVARRLLKLIQTGMPVAAVVVAVRNVGRWTPTADIRGVTRIPPRGAAGRRLRLRRRPRLR